MPPILSQGQNASITRGEHCLGEISKNCLIARGELPPLSREQADTRRAEPSFRATTTLSPGERVRGPLLGPPDPGESSGAQGVGNVKVRAFGPALVIVIVCSSDVRPSNDATTA